MMKYDLRGVSATKDDVHRAIEHTDKGLYPNAFCKVLPDFAANDAAYCNVMHADTAGTKTSLAYLAWRETGDLNVWKNIAQDALIMNLDDLGCIGLTSGFVVSSTIGRNKRLVSGDVVAALIQGTEAIAAELADLGVTLHLAGGETADVGDVVRTLDVGFTVFGRMPRREVLECHIHAGDVIVGFASSGQTLYESTYNSGIGSNGLTGARHDTLSKYYATQFPECYDTGMPDEVAFTGSRRLTDTVELQGKTYRTLDLLLSPTRTYLPLMRALFAELRPDLYADLHALIHCSGGGQTKVEKFARGLHIIKDNLFTPPPVFELIQRESGTDFEEMYRVFNMGHRLEAYLPEHAAETAIQLAATFGIEAQIIGRVEPATTYGQTRVTIETPEGVFEY